MLNYPDLTSVEIEEAYERLPEEEKVAVDALVDHLIENYRKLKSTGTHKLYFGRGMLNPISFIFNTAG